METFITPIGDLPKQKCVLLVEDDEISAQLEEWKLRKLGYQVRTATNGWEALEILQKNFCDLLLMNCHLLEMDGLYVALAIRSSDPKTINPDIPIIAMSAQYSDKDRELCLSAGMNDLLSKPVSSQELAAKLDYWLKRSSAGSGTPASTEMDEQSGEAPALAIFDEAELLERLMDDRQLEQMILEAFLSEMPLQIATLKGYVQDRSAANIRLQAHSMRGASANMAAHALRDAILKAETLAKNEDLDGMAMCIALIEIEYKRFERTIQSLEWMAGKGVQA